jgi:signal transduction histidine kinase
MLDPGTRALYPPPRGIRAMIRRVGRRLGIAQAALLLALLVPLVPGTWAFSELAARRETNRVDAQLRSSLAAAVAEYSDALDRARNRAGDVAARAAVQRAFLAHDRATLRAVERRHPGIRLLLPEDAAPQADAAPQVDVSAGGREVGRVVVPVHLEGEVLKQLRAHAVLGPDERVAILRGPESPPGATRPTVIRFHGVEYRALATTLRPGTPRISLAVMRKQTAVKAAVDNARSRTVILAVVALLAVALLAYLFAPTLARSRERRRQRSQAERVLSQLSDGVLEVDRDGVVTFVNPAAETLIGVPSSTVLGERAADTIAVWPALARGATTVPLDTGVGDRWLSVASVDADDGTVYTFRDVTRERRLEEMRAELIATVSHELRTPLAAVYGAAMTLQRAGTVDEPTRNQLVGIVGSQAERLAKIVDGILTASRASVEAEPLDEPFDVADVAGASVKAAAARTERTITFSADEEACRAVGSAEEARRVLDNVIDNAVKYSPDGSAIAVRLDCDAEAVRIEVADEGLGIPLEEQERIFERFYRLDPAMATGVGGTGLGLYIARRLVERMGGRLTVVSEAGTGSTFRIELARD